MKNLVFLTMFLSFSAFAEDWNSEYTNMDKDCVVISKSTPQSEIDFYEAECKSFGGYQLFISGGDLRYAPKLYFGGQELELRNPGSFHDLASKNVEWVYARSRSANGAGTLQWKGFIYRLSVADGAGGSRSVLYAVRLDGLDTCLVGTASNNIAARDLIKNSKPRCL